MFSAVLLLLIIVAVIAFAYHCCVHYSRVGRLMNQIPGPKILPVFGNLLLLQQTREQLWCLFRTLSDQYYTTFRFWNLHYRLVTIHHPDDIEVILNNTKHLEKGPLYDILRPWLNDGLLTSTGAKWHSRRKMLTPTFHFSILQEFTNILIEEGKHIVQKLKDVGGMVEVDIESFISEHTLNIICETAMGTSLHNLGTAQEKYRQEVRQMGRFFIYRVMRPWLNDTLFTLTPEGRKHKKTLQNLHGFTEKIIAERKMYHKRTDNKYLHNITNNDPMETDNAEILGIRKKRFAILDLLISMSQENNLSDLDIREEVDTFMFEGHDTTSMAICFTLLLLAEHKDIQDRVREEVKTVMQQCEGTLTMTSLQNLSYLERCLKESLRLYPSVFFITRVTAENVQLRDSYVIPRGTMTNLNIFHVHRDPNFWPNPDVFDPDRFLPEKIQKRHPYSYLPFSAGPRNCIGQRFAMLELKAIIAYLVHNFYLEPIDYLKDIRINIDFILRPNNMKIKFVPIQAA
ncbi:cytochrome P450 4C1-like [Odontomachus brunneus]|uniref:cytochrome P450 4C1-like n=1 Tax=Odontomachus brunneus TaxID=486640 RepID=UPI0013F22CD7|nr:cytochrome P450 4C1-like [Odontomachus brunneus]